MTLPKRFTKEEMDEMSRVPEMDTLRKEKIKELYHEAYLEIEEVSKRNMSLAKFIISRYAPMLDYDVRNMTMDEIILWVEKNIVAEYSGAELLKAYEALGRTDVFSSQVFIPACRQQRVE